MPLIVTPGQFSRRSEFYHQLAQLTAAGLGLVRALEQLKSHPPARSFREPTQRLLNELAAGYTLTESLQRLGHWLPAFDVAVLQAGEQSGRLDACFRLLADYYNDRARLARQVIADLAYPAFLLHFAILTFLVVQFFSSPNWAYWFGAAFGALLTLYLLVAFGIY